MPANEVRPVDAAANETGALVILVEEEPDERSAMSSLLRAAGFSVAAADTTDQALHLLEIARQTDEEPRVLALGETSLKPS